MNSKEKKIDSELEINIATRRMLREKATFESQFNEGIELFEVKEKLNNRVIFLKEQIINKPDNNNLNLELAFLEEEIKRIDEKIEEFNKEYETKEGQIKKSLQIIDYNIQDLYTYIEFLEILDTNKLLVTAIKECLKSIDENTYILNKIKEN